MEPIDGVFSIDDSIALYELEFLSKNGMEYEISAEDGKILGKDIDKD